LEGELILSISALFIVHSNFLMFSSQVNLKLPSNSETLELGTTDLGSDSKLRSFNRLAEHWAAQPDTGYLHVFVAPPPKFDGNQMLVQISKLRNVNSPYHSVNLVPLLP
jgi:hypothetical protein